MVKCWLGRSSFHGCDDIRNGRVRVPRLQPPLGVSETQQERGTLPRLHGRLGSSPATSRTANYGARQAKDMDSAHGNPAKEPWLMCGNRWTVCRPVTLSETHP